MADLIKIAEEAFATGKEFPKFKAGDTVTVAYKIVEGSKERIQLYRGVVIKINGHLEKKRFTVRKMSGTVGVERIFPIESPNIESIEVNKVGKVRRAKLYYLRKLTGKKARIKEKFVSEKKNAYTRRLPPRADVRKTHKRPRPSGAGLFFDAHVGAAGEFFPLFSCSFALFATCTVLITQQAKPFGRSGVGRVL